jgi:hypothetical protein
MLNVGARDGKGPLGTILDNEDGRAGKLMLPGLEKRREACLTRGRYDDDGLHRRTNAPEHGPLAASKRST